MIFNEMVLVYEGRLQSREKLLTDLLLKISNFITGNSFPPYVGTIQTVIREVLKNIHDHNGCWGFITINRLSNGDLVFQVRNRLNPKPEENEHSPENKVNFGVGLRLIRAKNPHFTIKTTTNLYEYVIICTPEI